MVRLNVSEPSHNGCWLPKSSADGIFGGLGLHPHTALTLGRAVAGSAARVKARNIGREERKVDCDADLPRLREEHVTAPVSLLGKTIRLLPNADGELRAADGDQPADPVGVERYLGSLTQRYVKRHGRLWSSGLVVLRCCRANAFLKPYPAILSEHGFPNTVHEHDFPPFYGEIGAAAWSFSIPGFSEHDSLSRAEVFFLRREPPPQKPCGNRKAK